MHVIRDIEGDFGLQVLLLLLENNDWNVPNLCRQLKLNNRGKLYSMFQSRGSTVKNLRKGKGASSVKTVIYSSEDVVIEMSFVRKENTLHTEIKILKGKVGRSK